MNTSPHQGKLKVWHRDRGFGFIRPDAGGKDVFLHISAVRKSLREPQTGDTILYIPVLQNDGRLRATNATIQGVALRPVANQKIARQPTKPIHQLSSAPKANSKFIWATGLSAIGVVVVGYLTLLPIVKSGFSAGGPAIPDNSSSTISDSRPAVPESSSATPESSSAKQGNSPDLPETSPDLQDDNSGIQDDSPLTPDSIPTPTPTSPATPETSPAIPESSPITTPTIDSTCAIKGNISWNAGRKYYHLPGMEDYVNTQIDLEKGERWFCTEAEAQAAGWVRAPTP